ncbi:hypothetical protein BURPS406E_R0116 [Burkholderia pseudomallei 406e]|uniref:Uncharacterized protein n=3 Tax=pseudomallei group TaxID=111527 RepID=A2SAF8_BURM9|nr:hypothetical protein BMASAVP1_A2303 [Burkholderia mallei SAVP1]ABN00981.1 hypothetical protein BMA10229_A2983 [Burkholderia mallei NCTC 10229]ABN84715.1 hypothetical protein BURPS668_1053 [Burkholderia pseudomallei 668]ABN89995.1 hypothetical protein BURPS1106A_1058 [Burkholderia pseudomallei 1106a]ABO06474.1 hypothetical protein BMA10247_1616 [Burkholderia mallei NCTC 10247]AFR14934.1 hypothetical protein BPC006_I1048 [Burkholderia pseudomallei BPC006]EBA47532.1 hypothetical protein BURPS
MPASGRAAAQHFRRAARAVRHRATGDNLAAPPETFNP